MIHKNVLSFLVITLAVLFKTADGAPSHFGSQTWSMGWSPWTDGTRQIGWPGSMSQPMASPWVVKRSLSTMGKRLEIMINIDQCHFDVYDIDGDGVVTLTEMRILFLDDKTAEDLFKALDLTTADDRVTKEEFQYMAPRTIANCETTKL